MEETEDLIDSIRTLKGHTVAALFKEQDAAGQGEPPFQAGLRHRQGRAIARGGGHKGRRLHSRARNIEDAVEELKEALGAI